MAKKIGPEENYWTPYQRELMKMVQRHPITYIRDFMMTPTQYKAALTTAWDRIARELRVPQKACRWEWTTIKFRFAKLNNMIHNGKLTEEIIVLHPKTCKYLDGSLAFMDAYIDDIDDDEIPLAIHKRFNKMFGITSKRGVTKEMVHALLKKRAQEEEPNDEMGKIHVQNLMNIVEDAVERSLREMTNATGIGPAPSTSTVEDPEHRTTG